MKHTIFSTKVLKVICCNLMIWTSLLSSRLIQRNVRVPFSSSFISRKSSGSDIHNAIESQSNKEKGDKYEIQICNQLRASGKQAYLWSDTPVQLLINCGMIASHNIHRLNRIEASDEAKLNPLPDTGVDINFFDSDGTCTIVQCKNGYKNGITYEGLTGFLVWLFHHENLYGQVYHTDKISQNLREMPPNPRLTYIKQSFIETANIIITTNSDMQPHQYQLDVVKCFKEKIENRGILSMPCGTGKTVSSYLISKDHKQIIILSPLKQQTKQSLDKFIEYGYPKENTLLVDSDGERDIDNIKKFIENNVSFLISAAFDSVDVIKKALPFMEKPFIIVDEFHNLSERNVMDKDDDFYGVLNSEHNILFMSATPRVYEMEGDADDHYQRVFGTIIPSMSFRYAIENKYICDFKIWLPFISSDDKQLNNEITRVLSVHDINPKLIDKCNFLLLSLSNTGSMKCIIYCMDTKEIAELIKALNISNEFHQFEYDVSQITCSDSEISRKEILNNFATSYKRQLLFSVRILDEGIDIPSCDSIFITFPSKSKIRTIQRMNRCTRIDKSHPFKIDDIFIWCDEYHEMLNTLCELKDYDPLFKERIVISDIDYYGNMNDRKSWNDDKEVLDDLIYKVDTRAYDLKGWGERLLDLREYIIENKKFPSVTSSDSYVKSLGMWRNSQQWNYNNKEKKMKIGATNRDDWSDLMAEFEELFLSNELLLSNDEKWKSSLATVENYVKANNKLPPSTKNDPDIELGRWLNKQQRNCRNEENIMKNAMIRDVWREFIDKYKEFFLSNDEKWKSRLAEVENYIKANNKLPPRSDNDPDIKSLSSWLNNQQRHYRNEEKIMKNAMIRDLWREFIDEYEEFFLSYDEKWKSRLAEVENHIKANNKLPFRSDNDPDIKSLGEWLHTQQQSYKYEENIMKNAMIRDIWREFIDKYEVFFLSNDEKWESRLAEVESYVKANNKLPPRNDNDPDIKSLGEWLYTQQRSYKHEENIMKNAMIRDIWREFIDKNKNALLPIIKI